LKHNDTDNIDKTIEISNNLSSKEDIEYADPVTLTEIRKSMMQLLLGNTLISNDISVILDKRGTPNRPASIACEKITEGNSQIVQLISMIVWLALLT
jgi:hypothetical protein